MGRGSYNGGSSIEGPGAAYWRRDPDDRPKAKKPDPELEQIMREHDRLRAQGRDPMAELSAAKKRRKRNKHKKKSKSSNLI